MNKLILSLSDLRSSPWLLRLLLRQATHPHFRLLCAALSGFLWWSALTTPAMAQGDAAAPQKLPVPTEEELSPAPAKVAVPIAHGEEILHQRSPRQGRFDRRQ